MKHLLESIDQLMAWYQLKKLPDQGIAGHLHIQVKCTGFPFPILAASEDLP